MKPAALTVCPGFLKVNGHLALKGTIRAYKFCGHCGEKMPSDMAQLRRHIKRQHENNESKFLVYGELPTNSKFDNFEEFLAGSST